MRTPVTVGVVCGANGLGDGLARVFDGLPQAVLRWICDDARRITSVGYGPATAWTSDFDELLHDEDLDAIVFASPELSGRGRAAAALAAEKHVLVDGPLASSSLESDELVAAAARGKRTLMATAPRLHRPEVLRLHNLIDRGALGEIFYVHARRYALRPEGDGDLLRSLGLDLVALVLDVLGDEPIEVTARGESYLGRSSADVMFGKLCFATGINAYVHLSYLEGESVDSVSVVGSKATAVLDATDPERALAICANGATPAAFGELPVEHGDRLVYRLGDEDPLRLACSRFLTAVRSEDDRRVGREAAATLAVIEALELSSLNLGAAEAVSRGAPQPGQNVLAFRSR